MLDEQAIKGAVTAAVSAEQGPADWVPIRELAVTIFDAQPDLMWEAQRVWAIDRLAGMIRRERDRQGRNRARQRRQKWDVAGATAWDDLPRTIFLRDHTRPALAYCRLTETEEHLAVLRSARRKDPERIAQMAALVEIHRKWAEQVRGIMWCTALEKEQEALVQHATKV